VKPLGEKRKIMVSNKTILEMKEYYCKRATEYDEWWYRQGRYDRGPDVKVRWFEEANQISTTLEQFKIEGDILELAAGTGIWTEKLLRSAGTITVIDSSQEMIEINRSKVASNKVSYILADIFTWTPDRKYDAVCFSFWISHVPLERLQQFLNTVAAALKEKGKIFFVDSRPEPSGSAIDHQLPNEGVETMKRRLNDGSEYEIVKNYFNKSNLTGQFAAAGIEMDIRETETFFIYGLGTKMLWKNS
jgi:ubiquinone/menaquinone biosynthesis C-methylase UbiE